MTTAALPAAPAAPAPAGPAWLPPLREDLALFEGPREADGSPIWTVYDPVRHRYFRFGRAAFEILARWRLGAAAAVLEAVAAETTLVPEAESLEQLVHFLQANSLLRTDAPAAVERLVRQAQAGRLSWPMWLLRHYLFIRIPLVRPDRFLVVTLPAARLAAGRGPLMLVLALGALGLILAVQQWDGFVHTALHFFSPAGAVAFALALTATKLCHELAHAYTAKAFGCRVPTMGVAFLVLWPVLYTDVSDAWRLVSRRRRLLIGAAGMLAELGLALLATFLWSFLPDGPVRSAAFVVATTSWVTTLAINLSPFMRFDGYYLLSDALGVSNLQDRSFALARWHLRRLLFGWPAPPPELFAPRLHRLLLAYAWATWLYRLVLFLGIALLVYHLFFKLLGLALFVVEMGWFIARPLAQELGVWWRGRRQFRCNINLAATLAALGLLLALAVTPWHSRITLPAVLRAAEYATLYPPVPARLRAIHAETGRDVAAGTVLFELEAPELESRLVQVRLRSELLDLRIRRQAGSREELEKLAVLQQELAAMLSAEAGLLARREQLVLRAPFAGTVTDVPPDLHPGLWMKPDQPLGRLVDRTRAALRGYLDAAELDRVALGAAGRFLPEDLARPGVAVRVVEIERVNAQLLDLPMLASTQEGPIAVQPGPHGGLVPAGAVYRVALVPAEPVAAPAQVIRGWVVVEGEARSLLARAWRIAAAVAVRESGF